MIYKKINCCRICGNENLSEIIDLGMQALGGRFPRIGEVDPPSAPLVLVKCNGKDSCGLLQLKHDISGEELFRHEYGYRSGINTTMVNHLDSVRAKIEKRMNLKKGDIVLDIGSNDATFLKSYTVKGLQKIGIDPTSDHFKKHYTKDIIRVPDFFSKESYDKHLSEKAKVITSIAMFYDLPDPMAFVKDIKNTLHPEGIWVLEQSYMPFMLRQNAFDTICHEHLEYYAFKQINWLLKANDLKAIDIDFNDINGGSFRVTVAHKDAKVFSNVKIITSTLFKEHQMKLDILEPYEEFVERIENIKDETMFFISSKFKQGKTFYLYGASTKGNTLLQYYRLNDKMIVGAAERNPKKYGKMTPLTHIPIMSEKDVRAAKPDYMLVLPWHFKKEFIKREKEYLKEGNFIFPLPKFSVV